MGDSFWGATNQESPGSILIAELRVSQGKSLCTFADPYAPLSRDHGEHEYERRVLEGEVTPFPAFMQTALRTYIAGSSLSLLPLNIPLYEILRV